MNEPLVACIILIDGREQMVHRAIRSYMGQTYPNRKLILWDTGRPQFQSCELVARDPRVWHWGGGERKSIGALRNDAIAWALDGLSPHPEIFMHMDSDDISHPMRMAEQVALLQASGADCVGYYEAPFWDTRQVRIVGDDEADYPIACAARGETWLYTELTRRIPLGASLCYWRSAWERRPFDDVNHGEDARFTQGLRNVAVTAMGGTVDDGRAISLDLQPRLICGVHGGNTSHGYDFSKRSCGFKRAPHLDAICAEAMRL